MSNFWSKQPSSRMLISQGTAISTAGANASVAVGNPFGPQTRQIRVSSNIAGWFTVGDGAQTAAQGTGAYIPNTGAPEYFTVQPGQSAAFLTTSTSTGFLSVLEMA
jgi:hypothetical protein